MALDPLLQDNLNNWNDRVPVHLKGYGIEAFDDPAYLSRVVRYDAEALGDIGGLDIAHLQCHIGTDSVSLARLGASVTGLDFSEPALVAARELASRHDDDATFVCSPVYDAAAALGRTFDLVYTTVGALNWLDDLDRWGAAVGGLLEPGGRLFVRDQHPMLWVFEEIDGDLVPTYPYVTPNDQPFVSDEAQTYVEGDVGGITHTRNNEWNPTIAQLITALVSNGLSITRFAEHERIEWQCYPCAMQEGDGWYLPARYRKIIPTMFTIEAVKV